MPRNPNVMGYPFPPSTQAVSSFPVFSFSFCHSSLLVLVTNTSFFDLQPTIQEHEELVWLAGNLKSEVTNYSRELYGLGGVAHPGDGDDDDDDDDGGNGDEEDSEATPSYQPRKRWHQGTSSSYIDFFFFFIIPLSKHLDLF